MAHSLAEHAGRPADAASSDQKEGGGRESGMIPLVTVVAVLGLVVMISLVGNLGAVVGEKVEVQNAADAVAYSDALWMARGMNSITAANHLMGEATALVVLIDALGGPEIGREEQSSQSVSMNESISMMLEPALIVSTYDVGGSMRQADQMLLETVADMFTDDKGRHAVWATVYDGQLTLKSSLLTALNTKALSNVAATAISFIAPLAPFIQALNVAIHVGVDLLVVKLAQEWVVLKGVEFGAEILGSAEAGPSRLLRELVIPTLSQFGETTAGGSREFGTVAAPTAINRSVERTHKLLRSSHRVAEVVSFPAPADLRLPVVPEPPPDSETSGGAVGPPPSLWPGRAPSGPIAELVKLERRVLDAVSEVTRWVDRINSIGLGLLPRKFRPPDIGSLLESVAPQPPGPLGEKFGGRGYASNRSLSELEEKYACDWRAESRSQWVRATFPQVNSLRAPIRRFFRETMESSGTADYYVHWTDRYTIAESRALRKASNGSSGTLGSGPPRMYVMRDMDPDAKGTEPWTWDEPLADRLFTVLALARRDPAPAPFAPTLFGAPKRGGTVAIAQAMFYNANGRDPYRRTDGRQPDTGWDTLNWAPPVAAPEWGAAPEGGGASLGAFSFPTKVFTGPIRPTPAAKIQLNWQAKLTPITVDRVDAVAKTPKLSAPLREAAQTVRDHASKLLSH